MLLLLFPPFCFTFLLTIFSFPSLFRSSSFLFPLLLLVLIFLYAISQTKYKWKSSPHESLVETVKHLEVLIEHLLVINRELGSVMGDVCMWTGEHEESKRLSLPLSFIQKLDSFQLKRQNTQRLDNNQPGS